MRNVWRFCKLEIQPGRLPVSSLPLKARFSRRGAEHKAAGKVPPIDVPSITTARKTRLELLLFDTLEVACCRKRLDGREPLSLGLFDSIMLMRDGNAHFDGNAPVRALLCKSMDSKTGKLMARQLGRAPERAFSDRTRSLSADASQSSSGIGP